MKYAAFFALLLWPFFSAGQSLTLRVRPVFQGKPIELEQAFQTTDGDSLSLYTLRFYLSNFVFLKNGKNVFVEKESHHLLDLEAKKSLELDFDLPSGTVFDMISFDLGVDSLTHTAGAMGGDLDPTKGMFWSWQSGYIHFKAEGYYEKCPAQNREFQFHLGGYQGPFKSYRRVIVSVLKNNNLQVDFDLSAFFENADWTKKYNVMSPGTEAVRLTELLAKSFSVNEE